MTRSWLQIILIPLNLGFKIIGKKNRGERGSSSNLLASDWNIHSEYFELKVENERLKNELQKLSTN
ncbi:hypothetical protein ACFQ3W_06145 [Paenibacillus puldeungensis]|uniref:BZIP domain-containing protein n=1 Tax=Paenibacillus puldeungensis TaxID=696536 RepID=A0ABW3RVE4_9BACL